MPDLTPEKLRELRRLALLDEVERLAGLDNAGEA
jgi:hypothetical protein